MGNVIGGIFGGGKGVSYTPTAANIQTPVTNQQAGDAYTNAYQGLNNQQQLLSALQGQNGIQNQSNVFNQMSNVAAGQGPNPAQAMLANTTGQNIASQAALMAGQRGAGQNAGLLARQAAMQGGNLQQQAAGQGAALQAQQSLNALGQMGGLSTNQVNQQQNAVNAYTNAAQSEQQNLLNAIAQQNNANVNMQGNMNTVGGNLANTVAGGQMGGMGGLFNSAGGLSGIAGGLGKGLGSIFGGGSTPMPNQNNPGTYAGSYSPPGAVGDSTTPSADMGNPLNAGTDTLQTATPEMTNGVTDAFNNALGEGGDAANIVGDFAEGGEVEEQPEAPIVPDNNTPLIASQGATSGPKSSLGKMLSNSPSPDNYALANQAMAPRAAASSGGMDPLSMMGSMTPSMDQLKNSFVATAPIAGQIAGNIFGGMFGGPLGGMAGGVAGKAIGTEASKDVSNMARGGKVPALVSPGERYLPPKEVDKVAEGKKSPMKAGEKIPGKPKVAGDKNSYKNDTVHKTLQEGGIVLPRSVTQAKDPALAAHQFVTKILAKEGRK